MSCSVEFVPTVSNGPEPAVVIQNGVIIRDDAVNWEVLEGFPIHSVFGHDLCWNLVMNSLPIGCEVCGREARLRGVSYFGVDESGLPRRMLAKSFCDACPDVESKLTEFRIQQRIGRGRAIGVAFAVDALECGLGL